MRPVRSINNYGWKSVRRKLDMPIRVHDLKHTFGRRLRAAGVPLETRKILLGHENGDITTHYSAPELEELIEAANRVYEGTSGSGDLLDYDYTSSSVKAFSNASADYRSAPFPI